MCIAATRSLTSSAHRAAALTQRLLAFARRQSLDTRPNEVNRLVAGMEDLLQRTLGEHIELVCKLSDDIWTASTDANQLENALLNLAIAARDAMPAGGRLTIETANVLLDEEYASSHEDVQPGNYVSVSVSDTGSGMSPEVLAKAIDPFFSTKPIGEGTGLGLSVIYGFGKQSHGHLRLYSEPGRGTTVIIYLPRSHQTAIELTIANRDTPRGYGETILIVEDDTTVRQIISDALKNLGYQVLEAPDARAGIPLLQSELRIDLLISDVMLPHVNGRKLAETARVSRPDLKVLFVTGYAENATTRSEFLDAGMDMRLKPFALDVLGAKVRAMIERTGDLAERTAVATHSAISRRTGALYGDSAMKDWPWYAVLLVALLATRSMCASAASVLMVSVDGMKPEYVTQSDAHGLKIPFLRSLLADGTYASGVVGVWPTNTYPSHTTLLTGRAPAEHGVYNNVEFDPRHKFAESWYWYTSQIKVPTLWQAAKQAHLVTASVGWPVSVGSPDIDYLIPEYWRIFHPTADLNPSDRYMIAALSRPAGLLEEMQSRLGPYLMGNDSGVAADEIKTRFALDILGRHRPRFMTIHLSALDDAEHEHGPFSAEANRVLEATDDMLSRLAAAARANDPKAIAVVVSDHGFTSLTHRVNLLIPFIQAGLITMIHDVGSPPQVTGWAAEPWLAGGMAAIMLRDAGDKATQDKVRDLLQRLQSDPNNGIAAVLDAEAVHQRAAFPGASFLVVMRPGYYTGNATSGDMVSDMMGHGGHGFAPDEPDMHASFFMSGPGIARHRDLGVIDMRQIAPTVAGQLAVHLPGGAMPLPVRQ